MKKAFFAVTILLGLSITGCLKEPEQIKVSSVILNTNSFSLFEGETGIISASVIPSDAANKTIHWSTSDSDIVMVNEGIVTAGKIGTATITATSDDGGKTATCQVDVKAKTIAVESVILDKTHLELVEGDELMLTISIKPDNATNKNVTWSSDNEVSATVNDGKVTAIKAGTATITAKSEDGGLTATCTVVVKEKDYKSIPFTIKSHGNTLISILKSGFPPTVSLEYKKNNDDWESYIIGTPIVLSDGEILQFQAGQGGNNSFASISKDRCVEYNNFVVSGAGTIDVFGNIMSLLDKTLQGDYVNNCAFSYLFSSCRVLRDASKLILPATSLSDDCYCGMFSDCTSLTAAPDLPATRLSDNCYSGMFKGCTCLTDAPELPATSLSDYCYYGMFIGCTSLTDAPDLPATSLSDYCYQYMFEGCTSLINAPDLPATSLSDYCYQYMFRYCTSLTDAPDLPATSLSHYCYRYMFEGCTSLINAPDLPATSLSDYCYECMFSDCTSLVNAPDLPATSLSDYCYHCMFEGCASLINAPDLPATRLSQYCYRYMFEGCTSLINAPDLPATILSADCYYGMFSGCASLIKAPDLPATSLSDYCYQYMFSDCTSLTDAPDLPATRLRDYCYRYMFKGCTNLSYVKCMSLATSSSRYTYDWLTGVSARGTFVQKEGVSWTRGSSGIPQGWTILTE